MLSSHSWFFSRIFFIIRIIKRLVFKWCSHFLFPGFSLFNLFSIGFTLFYNRNIYCSCCCPFGALQELFCRLNKKKKIKIPELIINYRKTIRNIYFSIMIIQLFSIIPFDISYFEPFSAFLFLSASVFTLIFASLILIISFFIPRFWCRFFCPTGRLIDLLKG